jgi:hypothetical protein
VPLLNTSLRHHLRRSDEFSLGVELENETWIGVIVDIGGEEVFVIGAVGGAHSHQSFV